MDVACPQENIGHDPLMARILVALSGGVDSTAAAHLACNAAQGETNTASDTVQPGDTIVGVTLLLWGGDQHSRSCSTADRHAAADAANELGIEHIVLDYRDMFHNTVVQPFAQAAQHGITLNPCLTCNQTFKFGTLVHWARKQHFDRIVTGHYARIVGHDGRQWVGRALDRDKDQSYVLAGIDNALGDVAFPLGSMTKTEVRAIAHQAALSPAGRSESMGLCFDPEKVTTTTPVTLSRNGRNIGEGRIERLTVGQRWKTGGLEEPLYIGSIDAATATAVLHTATEMFDTTLHVTKWAGTNSDRVLVQTNAHGKVAPATVNANSNGATIVFDQPTRRVAPGQTVVCYSDNDWDTQRLIGTGIAS